MSDKLDLVSTYLIKLFRHKELVAAAYHQGVVAKGDDRYDGRGLYELHQVRTLVPYAQDTYRLGSSLAKHLDEVLQKEQLYAAVGANVGELAHRLPLLADAVARANLEGRIDDADLYTDQFDRGVFELADSISGALQLLRVMADNKFSNVSTLAEKRRQNEFYIERAKIIGDALLLLQANGLMEILEGVPNGERLIFAYRSQLDDQLPEWRSSLLDITAILKAYLFRLRQVEPAARRFRAFSLFLKRTPDYVPPEIDEIAEPPSWACKATGYRLKSSAVISSADNSEILVDIARSIPSAKQQLIPVPRIGRLEFDLNSPAQEIVEIKAWQTGLQDLLRTVTQTPASVIEWKQDRPYLASIPNDIWLLCLLHEQSLKLQRSRGIQFEDVVVAGSPLSGCLSIRDILISRAPHDR
jgi:hypothetical protein